VKQLSISAVLVMSCMRVGTAQAQNDEAARAELVKQTQNPVASLISVPFQNNTNFPIGNYGRVQNILNIQPVIPIRLTEDLNLITRVIIPVVFQPNINTASLGVSGFGDVNPTFFLSPAKASKLIWGIGPTFSLRTETNSVLGNGKWGAGPSVVGLVQPKRWTLGALANNIWSFTGDKDRPKVNSFLLQYFVNYNLNNGWYLGSQPILTANWETPKGNQWLVPFGGGFGRVFRLGKQPVNAQLTSYYNLVCPNQTVCAPWTVRFQLALLYPKAR
jgi:hypothetical protein